MELPSDPSGLRQTLRLLIDQHRGDWYVLEGERLGKEELLQSLLAEEGSDTRKRSLAYTKGAVIANRRSQVDALRQALAQLSFRQEEMEAVMESREAQLAELPPDGEAPDESVQEPGAAALPVRKAPKGRKGVPGEDTEGVEASGEGPDEEEVSG